VHIRVKRPQYTLKSITHSVPFEKNFFVDQWIINITLRSLHTWGSKQGQCRVLSSSLLKTSTTWNQETLRN